MRLSIVVAASQNNVIGKGNQLPWRLPDDLKRFKALTMGKPIIMGGKTFDSIGKPLPGRLNIVVTRQPTLRIEGVVVVHSADAALAAAGAVEEAVLVGGADLYQQLLPRTDVVHLTRVHTMVDGDAFLPELSPDKWRETAREEHAADERHAFAFTYLTLERVRADSRAVHTSDAASRQA